MTEKSNNITEVMFIPDEGGSMADLESDTINRDFNGRPKD